MSFSYSLSALSNPEHTDHELAQLRLALGDTVEAHKHLDDEEILFLRSKNPTSMDATIASCAEMIAMRYAHEASFSVGDAKYDLDKRAERWNTLAESYRNRGGGLSGGFPEPMYPARRPYFHEDMTHPTYWDDFLERIHER